MTNRSLFLTLGLLLAMATPSLAAPYVVKGFRDAHFGDTQDKVIAAATKDFSVKPADIQHLTDKVDGTTALAVPVASLPPAPGNATITYIFGKTGGLVHINVVWLMNGNVTPADRANIIRAGVQLTDYFKSFTWPPKATSENIPVGPNNVSMFTGKDAAGNAVEVSADGITFQRDINGKEVQAPPVTGPARLRVAYGAANEGNAVAKIAPGQF